MPSVTAHASRLEGWVFNPRPRPQVNGRSAPGQERSPQLPGNKQITGFALSPIAVTQNQIKNHVTINVFTS